MIEITPRIGIEESELHIDFIRSSGPGGQNVNKVATGVQLRFNIDGSKTLPDDVKTRLRALAKNRINDAGDLVIEAKRFRSQEQNRADAIARLVTLIGRAAERPRVRKKTRIPAAARAARLEKKKRRGEIKRSRKPAQKEAD
ncbi:MAG TPA: alternative ribosome rescue aminoacyl-tRNA hydrolase ArfB [Anaerolineales bacterium]|nr:alternative ribosome rescue aminoacyl-tRNA hydrolase ArfB [Anaerolineales bacterium]